MRVHFRTAVLGAGGAAALASVLLDHRDAVVSAARSWPPFVLVAGLLVIGAVANEDGVFAGAGALLDRLPGGDICLYLAAMGLVALVTVFLNLDTAAAFLTPVLIYVADKRRADQARLLYGSVFMANAASLLLPGSNLTNLLVLASGRLRAAPFFTRMLGPWGAAVGVTAAVVGVGFRSPRSGQEAAGSPGRRAQPGRPAVLTLAAIAVAAALILVVPDAALPVAAVGVVLLALRAGRHRIRLAQVAEAVDLATIAGLFLAATALGTLSRAWSYPAAVMRTAGAVRAALAGAVASVAVNNLPAAVLLGSRGPAHPVPLLFGLDIGPNLAVTGSLSALVWWRAATSSGVTPSVRRYSAVGCVLVPLSLGAALVAYALIG
ncbi:MAG TPA: SLC13 family permease [Actinomycetota bacterium]|nr:SLC13 family permease [Actinomycetota bacterium]